MSFSWHRKDIKKTSLVIEFLATVQWCAIENHQDPFYVVNEGNLTEKKNILKILLAPWNFDTVWKKYRSFNAENLGSVDQWAAKLPAVKLREW